VITIAAKKNSEKKKALSENALRRIKIISSERNRKAIQRTRRKLVRIRNATSLATRIVAKRKRQKRMIVRKRRKRAVARKRRSRQMQLATANKTTKSLLKMTSRSQVAKIKKKSARKREAFRRRARTRGIAKKIRKRTDN